MGALLLTAGTRASVLLCRTQVSLSTSRPAVPAARRPTFRIMAEEILRMRELTSRIIANHSGQSFDQVEKDVERDRILTPIQAKEYGLIDEVIEHRRNSCRLSVCRSSVEEKMAAKGYRELIVWQNRCSS
jgi:ATP-dependent Clp protease protease subunit